MTKEGSGGEEIKSTPHLLPESSWRAEPEWSPLLSEAQTPALDRKWQHTHIHTQEVHPTKDREQRNKTKMGVKNKTTTQKIISRNNKRRMHANHGSKERMQQRTMVKLAIWQSVRQVGVMHGDTSPDFLPLFSSNDVSDFKMGDQNYFSCSYGE